METFFEIIKILLIGFFGLAALFLILMSLPKSKLRNFVLEIGGWTTAAGAAAYVISPVDLIPGWIIPVLGQLDDIGVAIVGIFAIILAKTMRNQRLKMERE